MQKGEKWLCSNWSCGGEVVVTESSRLGADKTERLRCVCGNSMTRPYEKPSLGKVTIVDNELFHEAFGDSLHPVRGRNGFEHR